MITWISLVAKVHGTPQANLDEVFALCMAWWEEHYGHIELSITTLSDVHDLQPQLKGKAIEVNTRVTAVIHVWSHFMDHESVVHHAVLGGVVASAEMDGISDSHSDEDKLPLSAGQSFVNASWQYCRCQNAVAYHWNNNCGLMIFNVTIKTHWTLQHAMEALFFNPRKTWNLSGEDFMHKCKVLMAACTRGNSGPHSVAKFLTKSASHCIW